MCVCVLFLKTIHQLERSVLACLLACLWLIMNAVYNFFWVEIKVEKNTTLAHSLSLTHTRTLSFVHQFTNI